ncbi:MAG TPA: N-acetyl-D-Glu racemase DgcA [Nevskiaceae bacterium]|nr:N-acetyl-D-Glu racemase DgcA [Nevskiaceae bacterium]
MKRALKIYRHTWPMAEPFTIARGTQTHAEVVVAELAAGAHVGRGEAVGVSYHGETPDALLAQIERVRDAIEAGADRQDLLKLLPAGGARNAVDGALWDLEAKLTGVPAWRRAGLASGGPVTSCITIGIRPLEAYEKAAATLADHPWIKVKVDRTDPLAAVQAVRRGAPKPKLVVDANQSWSVEEVKSFGPQMADLGVALLEQPMAQGPDDALLGVHCPVPICADESISTVDDLPRLAGRYQFINIKLDKTGGLTHALELARAAQKAGLRLMSGCMVGGSVAMAPAMVLAQLCEINDLDGPVLQAADWPGGIVYTRGVMSPPWPQFWG